MIDSPELQQNGEGILFTSGTDDNVHGFSLQSLPMRTLDPIQPKSSKSSESG